MASKYRVSVNLPEKEYKELAALSEKHRISMAWLGRKAIVEFLERNRQEALQFPLTLAPKQRTANS